MACLLAAPVAAQQDKPLVDDTTKPMDPGAHWLSFEHEYDGETRQRKYGLYLPPNITEAAKPNGKKLALVVCLAGRGGLGETYDKIYVESAIGMVHNHKFQGKPVDFMILRPVSATYGGWDDKKTSDYIVTAIKRVIAHYPVDPKAVHLIGMSLGGEGVWHVAEAGPGMFATIVSNSGRQHHDPAAVAKAAKGCTVVITVGDQDGEFTAGAAAMAKAMGEADDIDLHYIVMPGQGHGAFHHYYYRVDMYQWMVQHRRGEEPPADRADDTTLGSWGYTRPASPMRVAFDKKLSEAFAKFRPHWFVENCRITEAVGLHERVEHDDVVFITQPLNGRVPCRLITTAKIPADQKTTLHLTVGHYPNDPWQLVVNVASKTRLSKQLGKEFEDSDTPQWQTFEIDLTEHAGQKVFVELQNRRVKHHRSRAGWAKIEITGEPK